MDMHHDTPSQRKDRKIQRVCETFRRRRRIRKKKEQGHTTPPEPPVDDRAQAHQDQDNLIYVGGNYMGRPDFQEQFHDELMRRWRRSLI
jgi:uncharacterized membrane protein YccC